VTPFKAGDFPSSKRLGARLLPDQSSGLLHLFVPERSRGNAPPVLSPVEAVEEHIPRQGVAWLDHRASRLAPGRDLAQNLLMSDDGGGFQVGLFGKKVET